jgi:FkbM family methyltransferase
LGSIFLNRLRRVADAVPPAARSYRSVRDATRRLPTYETLFGFAITADPGIDTSRQASGEVGFFLDALKATTVVVDIGANVGFFTLLAATNHIPVVAVEPDAVNVQILLRNLQRAQSRLDVPVEVYPVALGAEPGLQTLFGTGQGASLIPGWGGIRATHGRRTPVTTVDRLLADRLAIVGETALIKLDVEGYEFEVLQGSERTLCLDPSPTWIVEHGLTQNFPPGGNPHFRDLFESFWSAGYVAHTVKGRRLTESDVDGWIKKRKVDSADINFIFRR